MRRGIGTLATVLRVVGLVIVAILVIHIVLTMFDANQANSFAEFIRAGANMFSLGLTDLFVPSDPKVAVGINYGIAAVAWLLITGIIVGLVRRARF